jgi:hypothetical protein
VWKLVVQYGGVWSNENVVGYLAFVRNGNLSLYNAVFADDNIFADVTEAAYARSITYFGVVAYHDVIPDNNVLTELNIFTD